MVPNPMTYKKPRGGKAKLIQEHHTYDAEMESDLDGDHRDAGSPRTVQFVSASPEPVVNFLIKSIPHD